MAFIFSTSHLPETRVRRPDHLEDEEEDDTMQPMPRAGGVRAFSHLPQPARAQADFEGPIHAYDEAVRHREGRFQHSVTAGREHSYGVEGYNIE